GRVELERAEDLLDAGPAIGRQGGRLAVPGRPVVVAERHEQELALGDGAIGGMQRHREPERAVLDPELHEGMPPLARMPAAYNTQKPSWSAPVPASAPFRAGPSVRVRTTPVRRKAGAIASSGS